MSFNDSGHVPSSTFPTLGGIAASLAVDAQGVIAAAKEAQQAFLASQISDEKRRALEAITNEQRTAVQAVMDSMATTARPAAVAQGAMLRDPANVQKLTNGKTIHVYVRKGGDNHERWLSFTIPDNIAQLEVMQKGIAIDGNQALWSVGRGEYDSNEKSWSYAGPLSDRIHNSLPDALLDEEQHVAEWLKDRGYTVIFS